MKLATVYTVAIGLVAGAVLALFPRRRRRYKPGSTAGKESVFLPEVKKLEDELAKSVALLQAIGFRGNEHYVQDRVVFGFLWQAVAAAEILFNEFTKAGHPYGLWPTLRQLQEIFVDLSYLEIHPEPDLQAYRVVLSEIMSIKEFWGLSKQIERELGEGPPRVKVGPYWEKSVAEIKQDLTAQAAAAGGDLENVGRLVEVAHASLQRDKHWHWSGMGYQQRVGWLRKHANISRGSDLVLRGVYGISSGRAHATANYLWLTMELSEEGVHQVPAPSFGDIDEVRMLAGMAAGYVELIRELVEGSDIPIHEKA